MGKNKTGFIEWNNNILINSLKRIDLNFVIIAILDAAFYVSVALSFTAWFRFIKSKEAAINFPSDPSQFAGFLAVEKSFYFLLVFSFIAIIVFTIFLVGIFKGVIWARTTKTKLTLKLISGFLLLNVIWLGFWSIIFFLISYLVQPSSVLFFLIASIVIAIYFTNIIYPSFLRNHNLKTIGQSLKLGVAKIHLFVLPNILIFLIFFILLWSMSQLRFNYAFIVGDGILILYVAFIRFYVSELTINAEKH